MTNFRAAGHSGPVRFLFGAAVTVALAGCSVPLDLRDGGDGGENPGTVRLCDPTAFTGSGMAGSRLFLSIGNCNDATIRAPDGSNVEVLHTSTGVTFTPPTPGEYELFAGGAHRYLFIDAVVPDDAGFTISYVDRIDECVTRYLTDEGTFVCESGTRLISAYDLDGGLKDRFYGAKLGVIGNEIWSTRGYDVEHRTDIDGGIRFDGRLRDDLVSMESEYWNGESTPGRSIRGSQRGVVEVLWDGGTLSTGRRVDLLNWPQGLPPIFEGNTLMGANGCTYRPGCATMLCTTLETCSPGRGITLTLDDEYRWEVSGMYQPGATVRVVPRVVNPEDAGVIYARDLPWALVAFPNHANASGALDPRVVNNPYDPSVEAVLVPTRHGFYMLKVDDIFTPQKNALLIKVDPFTVRIVPR